MPDYPERLAAMQPLWGTWYLDSLIGEGSYGKVYRLRREEFGTVLYSALKWIALPQSQGEIRSFKAEGMQEDSIREYYNSLVRNLQTEITLLSRLRGTSHIVSLEEHAFIERQEEIGWDVLIRMELLTPLPDRLGEGMTVGDVVRMGMDLCDALSLCAKHGIVHRDIKPDNIFYSENGDYKLGDFGVARQMERTQTSMSRKGTPYYMAPEVYFEQTSDASVDQYSLGLVMHRLLNAQQLPFAPMTDRILTHPEREAAFRARMKGDPVPPPVQGSVGLKQIITKACNFKARKRYASPEAMRAALVECLKDKGLDEPLILGTGSQVRSGRSSVSLDSSKSEGKGVKKPGIKGLIGIISAALVVLIGIGIFLLLREPTPLPPTALPTIAQMADAVDTPTIAVQTALPATAKPAVVTDVPTDAPAAIITAAPTAVPTIVPAPTNIVSPSAVVPTQTISIAPTAAAAVSASTVPVTSAPPIQAAATTPSGSSKGTQYTATEPGFAGPVTVFVTAREDGTITDLRIGDDQFSETERFGALVRESAFTNQLIGKKLPLNMADIDAVSGATITTLAVLDALNRAFTERLIGDTSSTAEAITAPPLAETPAAADALPIAVSPTPTAAQGDLVLHDSGILVFHDRMAKVEAAVRKAAGLSRDVPISIDDLASVTHLDLSDCGLTDISFLTWFDGVQVLLLDHNRIMDLSPLSELKSLAHLDVSANPITALSALGNLTALENLFVMECPVNDLAPLSSLTSLRHLYVCDTDVQDVSPLASLKNLELLYLYNNKITDIAPLAKLSSLRQLVLSGNQITDVTALATLYRLEWLHLAGNPIDDFSPLVELNNLTEKDFDIPKVVPVDSEAPGAESVELTLDALAKSNGLNGERAYVAVDGVIYDVTDSAAWQYGNHHGFEAGKDLTMEIKEYSPHGAELLKNVVAVGRLVLDYSPLASLSNQTNTDFPPPQLTPEPVSAPDAQSIALPNAKVEQAVREAAGLAKDAPITAAVVAGIRELALEDCGLEDVSFLSHFTGLRLLWLGCDPDIDSKERNRISDISPLSNLAALELLDLSGNMISDISPLNNMPSLSELYLYDNQIRDISPLSSLAALTHLSLYDNQIKDISPLENLSTLNILLMAGNQVSDISPLEHLTALTILSLNSNQISDITPMKNLTALTWVNIQENEISDVSALATLNNLETLYLSDNPIADYSPLSGLSSLTETDFVIPQPTPEPSPDPSTQIIALPNAKVEQAVREAAGLAKDAAITASVAEKIVSLDLSGCDIRELGFLSVFSHLEKLNVSNNRVVDVSPLMSLKFLTDLDLCNNRILNIFDLGSLSTLQSLNLSNNLIEALGISIEHSISYEYMIEDSKVHNAGWPLSSLKSVHTLKLGNNKISQIAQLAGMESLRTLDLHNNQISDVTGLSYTTALQDLDIRNNHVSDIAALVSLKSLHTLMISGNPLKMHSQLLSLQSLTTTDMPIGQSGATGAASSSKISALKVSQADDPSYVHVTWKDTSPNQTYLVSYQINTRNPVLPMKFDQWSDNTEAMLGPLIPNTSYKITVQSVASGKTIEKVYKTPEAKTYWRTTKELIPQTFFIAEAMGANKGVSFTTSTRARFLQELLNSNRNEDPFYRGVELSPSGMGVGTGSEIDKELADRKDSITHLMVILRIPNGDVCVLYEGYQYEHYPVSSELSVYFTQILDHYGRIPTGTYRVELYYDHQLAGKGSLGVR